MSRLDVWGQRFSCAGKAEEGAFFLHPFCRDCLYLPIKASVKSSSGSLHTSCFFSGSGMYMDPAAWLDCIFLFGNKFCMVGQKTGTYMKILRELIETSAIWKKGTHLEYVRVCNQEKWRTGMILCYFRGTFLFLLCWSAFPQLRSFRLFRPLDQQIFPSMSDMEANPLAVALLPNSHERKSVNLQVGRDNHLLFAQRAQGVLEGLGHPDEGRKNSWVNAKTIASRKLSMKLKLTWQIYCNLILSVYLLMYFTMWIIILGLFNPGLNQWH